MGGGGGAFLVAYVIAEYQYQRVAMVYHEASNRQTQDSDVYRLPNRLRHPIRGQKMTGAGSDQR